MRQFLTGEMSAIVADIKSTTWRPSDTAIRRHFDELRASLTLSEQTLSTLRYDRKMSWDEVAEVMSRAERQLDSAAVRKRCQRLKETLRKRAQERGLLPVREGDGPTGAERPKG